MARLMELAAAQAKVLDSLSPLAPRAVPLSAATDLVLAEDVRSDIDSPPHDKALVDGYAVASGHVSPSETLTVLEEVLAGGLPTQSVGKGSAVRIMTGAPLPPGADAVVMREDTELHGDQVRITTGAITPEQNVLRRATCVARGERVLRAGHQLRPLEIGLLAEVGCALPLVTPRPNVAILPTGDELVEMDVPPGPGQIRNSNGPMLTALVAANGGHPIALEIGADQPQPLAGALKQGLTHDALIISGGVSAGDRDLVPESLKSLGVTEVFHRVNLKPGKPLWFGCHTVEQVTRPVFGLPGNPISSLVCFLLFVRPALHLLLGWSDEPWIGEPARLMAAHRQQDQRLTYFPARALRADDDRVEVTPLDWKGSADLRAFADANCLIELAGGERDYPRGEQVTIYWI